MIKIIAILWLGLACAMAAYGIHALLSLDPIADGTGCFVISFLSTITGIGLVLSKKWGRILGICLSIFYLLYGSVFILFGGPDDTSPHYTIAVLALCGLSIASLSALFLKWIDQSAERS